MSERPARDPAEPTGFRRIEYVLVISACAFAAFLATAAALGGGGDAWRAVAGLGVGTLAAALGLSLANYAIRILRWHVYERRLGLDIPVGDSALFYVAGFALTTTPGKVGEALRLWLIERCHGYGYARSVPLLVADRVSDVIGIGLLSLLGLGILSDRAWVPLMGVATVAAVLVVVSRPGIALALASGLYRLVGRAPRLFGRVRGAIRDTAALFTPGLLLATTALAVAGWLAEGIAFALVLRALGADLGVMAAIVVFAAAMIVGSLTLLPGGLGGTEATMLVLLSALGVPFDAAVAATAVIRVTTLWFAVALGFLALPAALRRARRAAAGVPVPGAAA
jgi:uncharacterized membrane protein YbhN (UPF0104 family)